MAKHSETADSGPVIAPAAVLEVDFCHHLRRSSRAISRIYDRAFQPLGIKASQFNLLTVIAASHPAIVPRIAETLSMDRTTLLRNLRPLRDDGYLEIDAGSGRRPDEVRLTISGQDLLHRAVLAWRDAQTQVTRQLGGIAAGQLLQGLARLIG